MKKSMKIVLNVFIILIIIVTTCPMSFAKNNPTLENIASLFNVCKAAKKSQQDGTALLASTYVDDITNPNTPKEYLKIDIDDEVGPICLTYSFDSSRCFLTGEYVGQDPKIRDYWKEISEIIIDCIAQFHGYAEGEILDTLHTTQVENYSVENEGLTLEATSPNRYYMQINTTKAIPLVDVNTYIKEEDLKDLANNISGDGVAKLKKGNIVFYKYTVDNKDIITIGELDGFSYKIDKSIETIIKTIFGNDDVVEYYKKNYPTVENDKAFPGIIVEVNPVKNETEQHVFSEDLDYKFIRLTIDRTIVNEQVAKKTTNPETTNTVVPTTNTSAETGNKTTTTTTTVTTTTTTTTNTNTTNTNANKNTNKNEKLPKTGKEINWVVMGLYGVFSIAVLAIILITLNKKEA